MIKQYYAYAKINLHLDVLGKRPDSYHNLSMIMQSISLHDTVTVEIAPGSGFEILCDDPAIPTDARNIAWKAARAFRYTGGLRIAIEKRIPSGAGLAGGSADAAAVLAALRDMAAPDMPDEELRSIGARVGADVPFCLLGGCCLAQGIGDILTPLPCLPQAYAVALVKPEFSVSTAQAYAAIDAMASEDAMELRRPDTARAVAHAKQGNWESLFPLCANVFEQAIPLPGLEWAKAQAMQSGALLCRMTGSGSAVFAVYPRGASNEILCALEALGSKAAAYAPVGLGIEN